MSYSYQEVFEASKKYFNGSELPAKVFADKYALRDNLDNILELTPDDMHWRLANEFARIESKKFKKPLTAKQIYAYLKNFSKILPQGSPCYGIGNLHQYVSISNCFVIPSPADSYGGICKYDEELVQISKRRGGVGGDISTIRPNKAPTHNSSRTSTGIIPFMSRWSNSIREVGQDGRRGAEMITLDIRHPESVIPWDKKTDGEPYQIKLEDSDKSFSISSKYYNPKKIDFVTSKYDKTKVTGANISLRISDSFMKAALSGKTFRKQWPIDSKEPSIYEDIDASAAWDKIIYSAWQTAEPGVLFWDNILRESPADCYTDLNFKSESTNPCITGSTLVYVADGRGNISIQQLAEEGKDVDVFCYNNSGKVVIRKMRNPRVTGFNQPIYKLTLEDGLTIRVTGNHKFLLIDGTYRETKNLQAGDSIKILTRYEDPIVISNVNRTKYRVEIENYNIDSQLQETLIKAVLEGYEASIIYNIVFVERQCEECKNTFLVGYERREQGLCSEICSNLYLNKQRTNIKHNEASLFNHRVIFVELDGEENVYNGTVDDFHNFFVGGWESKTEKDKRKFLYINNQNCGEIPLSPYDSCRLLVLNLFGFVKNPFKRNAYFDYVEFYETAKIAQRLMDDLVDLEIEAVERIINKIEKDPEDETVKARELSLWKHILDACKKGRRTGTGITALGDTLAAIGIAYGSNEGIEATSDIYQTLKFGCYMSSVEMAEELGSFPIWNHELEKNNPFLNRIKNETLTLAKGKIISGYDIYDRMKINGRRNIALLTTAPVGSMSILAKLINNFDTSSGIEPRFRVKPYIRRKKGNPSDKNFRSDFVDQNGDHWQEFEVPMESGAIKDWMESTGESNVTKSPWYNNCAEDIDWTLRIKLQAAAQKHVDHSISSTVNLPEDVSVEKIKEIYETAWKSGCKGITIYRNNCRTGVLIDKKSTNNNTIIQNAIKRPKSLESEIYHVKVKGEEYFVIVGILDGKPYEVFAGKNGTIDKNFKTVTITKVKRGHYKATFEDETIIENISEYIDEDQEALTRMLSLTIRHNIDLNFAVHQLEKVKGHMQSFAKAISRILKKYIPDKQVVPGEACPNCNRDTLIREGGCKTCKECGYSGCN